MSNNSKAKAIADLLMSDTTKWWAGALIVQNATQAIVSGSPALVQNVTLAAANAAQPQTAASPTLTQAHRLAAAGVVMPQFSTSFIIFQNHILTVSERRKNTSGLLEF